MIGFGLINSHVVYSQAVTEDAQKLEELREKYNLNDPERNHQDVGLSETITDNTNPNSVNLSDSIMKGLCSGNNANTVYDLSKQIDERGTSDIRSGERGIALGLGLSHGVPVIVQDTREIDATYAREGTRKFYRDDDNNLVVEVIEESDVTHVEGMKQNGLTSNEIDKDSLTNYHRNIRRMLSAVITMPSSIKMPENVHIIGAIHIDETTHDLSPKILDRAHIMCFESPLLLDWDQILSEVNAYLFNEVNRPLLFDNDELGIRINYPKFKPGDEFTDLFIELNRNFFHKLGVEFGMRTIRQGLHYLTLFKDVNGDNVQALNNFLLHKVLPKFTFDGNKTVGQTTKLALIEKVLAERIRQALPDAEEMPESFSALHTLEEIVINAKSNDGVVNFWS